MTNKKLTDRLSEDKIILVVDDEQINVDYIRVVFSHYPYTILEARNGQEAIDFCLKIPEIKLVILDLCMPIVDGYTAARKIHEFLPELPIVAVTATWGETFEEALASGCIDAFDKPISREKLLELADRYLIENPY